MKDHNHVAVSIDEEKAFDRAQYPVTIRTFGKVGLEETYLTSRGKGRTQTLTANIILNGDELSASFCFS